MLFDLTWSYFFPAVWRARFYRTIGEVVIASAVVGGLVYGAALTVATVIDGFREAPGAVDRLTPSSGWRLVPFLLAWWSIGALLYSACRVWKAEHDSEIESFMRTLRVMKLKTGRIECNGVEAFGAWGRALLRPMTPREWNHEIGMQVVFRAHFNHEQHLLARPPVEAQALERLRLVEKVYRELEVHSMIDRAPGYMYEHPFDDTKYILNQRGRDALLVAQHKGGAFAQKYRFIPSDSTVT